MKKATRKKAGGEMDDAAIAAFHDAQSDHDIIGEMEAAFSDRLTVMATVPRSLLPDILKLLDKKKKTA